MPGRYILFRNSEQCDVTFMTYMIFQTLVAQLEERQPSKLDVAGSSPAKGEDIIPPSFCKVLQTIVAK